MTTELAQRRSDCDVLIIGGGVNGTGLARDLSLRGLRVILLERNDLAFGASGNSSGMIHGGPRYLTTHPAVTRSSCEDSGYIQSIAPHMIFRIPFVMPLFGHGIAARVRFDAYDAFFAVYDEYQPLKRGKPHTRLTPAEALTLVPGLRERDLFGAITFDEWGIYGNRLCVANATDAVEHGCKLYVHTTVERIVVEGGRATGVVARDLLDGRAYEFSARAVVNCTGAWSPITAATAGVERHVRVRPGKGVHLVLDRPVTDVGVMAEAIDGRQIFIEPWGNTSLIGTTDDDTYADLDDLPVTTDEVRYLVEGVERVLPRVRDARIIGTTVGARPSLYAGPVRGGDRVVDDDQLAARFELSRFAVERLVTRHGSRAETMLADSDRRGRMVVCAHEPVLACEVRWAAKHEYARTLADVARRTNLAHGACGGNDCALAGAVIAGEVLGWSPAEVRAQAAELLRARQRSRLPAIGDKQARAEALTMAALRALGRAALP
jgi:glycerol-3-phosphate dehydrogenase